MSNATVCARFFQMHPLSGIHYPYLLPIFVHIFISLRSQDPYLSSVVFLLAAGRSLENCLKSIALYKINFDSNHILQVMLKLVNTKKHKVVEDNKLKEDYRNASKNVTPKRNKGRSEYKTINSSCFSKLNKLELFS